MVTDNVGLELDIGDSVDVTADGEIVLYDFLGTVVEVNAEDDYIVVEDQEENAFCVDGSQCALVFD